jgi:quercetin dioxygenase-like cupin family protein
MRKIYRLAFCASLVVGIVTATPAISSATPSSGVTSATISDRVVGSTDFVVKKITIAPGGTTGWHYHPGPVYGVVEQGTLTHNHSNCSVDGVYGPGDLIFEQPGPGDVHIGRNLGTTPVVLLVLYVSQVGSPLAVSVPNPGCPFQ